jgi:predicted DNA-binding ribbon-helix-helix protein
VNGGKPVVDFGGTTLQQGTHMNSPIVKRSIVIGGHKTSVSLENAFWQGLKEIASGQHITLSVVVEGIDRSRQQSNLSSAIRLFVLDRLRMRTTKYSADGMDGIGADNTNDGVVERRA